MKVYEIAELIGKAFPPECAEEWDNIGLIVGRRDADVNKVLLTLDITPLVVKEAIDNNVQMIISHHPMMFSGRKTVTDDDIEGKMLLDLIDAKIAVYAAHTNLDCAKGGLNDKLSELFGLKDTEVVLKGDVDGAGLGRIGDLPSEMTALEFAELTKKVLKTPVRLSGDENKKIRRVSVGSGASDDIATQAIAMGADLVLTGDLKYHRTLDIVAMGAAVVDAGHYPTEIMAIDIFEEVLKNSGLEIEKSKNKDIFMYI